MIATKPVSAHLFEEAFQKLTSERYFKQPDLQTRLDAFAHFKKMGLPSIRQDEWKFTDLSRYTFNAFTTPLKSQVSFKQFQPLLPCPNSSQQFVYYNGHLLKSDSSSLFSMEPLDSQDNPVIPCYKNGLSALNRAFFQDGTCIVVPKNCIVYEPIYIIHIIDSENPILVHPRNLIRLEENSQATLVEMTLTLGNTLSFANSVSNIQLAKNAHLQHLLLQNPNQNCQISQVTIQQKEYSEYTGTVLNKGGVLNRAEVQVELQESYTKTKLYALSLAKEQQKIDTHLILEHQQPHCESETLSRSIVRDKARSSFTGKIIVKEGAFKTCASLQNKNCLLSPQAEANTRPQLEIYNDDVQCTHGATVSHLERDALFYLKSRGIPEQEAEELLINGFIYPALQGIPASCIDFVQRIIHEP